MSTASTSRTIKFSSKAGTYTAQIMSPSGDLYQEYEGTTTEVTNIYPDFSKLKPELYFVCSSSRVAEGNVTPVSVRYFFNGTEITFSGDTSVGIFAGYFKKINPAGDNLYYGLQILKNIAELSGFAPATIKMVAAVTYGTQSDIIQASYPIPIQQATGNSCRVTIAAGDNKKFVIREKKDSCILKAVASQGGKEITKDLTYKWEQMSATGWEVIDKQTAKTLVVREEDIQTYGDFRVTVARKGNNIGSDVQGVMDMSDPYEVLANPSPEDETISEDEGGNATVTYTPIVVKRGQSTRALDTLFFFVVTDAAGVYLNSAQDREKAVASYSVTRAHCQQSGGDVSVFITSEK